MHCHPPNYQCKVSTHMIVLCEENDNSIYHVGQQDWGLYYDGVKVICGVWGWVWCLHAHCGVRWRAECAAGWAWQTCVDGALCSLIDKSYFWFYLNIVHKGCITCSCIV